MTSSISQVLARVGLSVAPADAVAEVREAVDWVSRVNGGNGAVREFIEMVLRAQGVWDKTVASYVHERSAAAPAVAPAVAASPAGNVTRRDGGVG